MSTYPVDVKSANHSSVATHAIFAGPARVVGIYMSKEKINPYKIYRDRILVSIKRLLLRSLYLVEKFKQQ